MIPSTPVTDHRDFRQALSQFPTGVTVMTCLDTTGAPVGVTASSFNAVSLDPPLVLWSIDKTAFSANIFHHAPHFAVNVLTARQSDLSGHFARRGSDKFQDIDWHAGQHGCPVLPDVAALFQCRTWAVHDGGDHYIIVGEVLGYGYQTGQPPLIFARGQYAVPTPLANTM